MPENPTTLTEISEYFCLQHTRARFLCYKGLGVDIRNILYNLPLEFKAIYTEVE